MKNFFSPTAARIGMLAILLSTVDLGRAAQVTPATLAVSGDVLSGAATPVQKGTPVATGSEITTKGESGAIFRPVPGQNLFLDSSSSARVTSAEVTPGAAKDGGAVRSSSVRLLSGHLHSTVASPPSGENRQVVSTSCAEISSEDGSWSTWSNENGAEHAVVYGGTVMITITRQSAAIAEPASTAAPAPTKAVALRGGQVATWRCDGNEPILEVIDLRTGVVTQYLDGNQTGHRLATATELQDARDLLLAGLPGFQGTAATDHRLEFGQITGDINEVLRNNTLGGIPPSSDAFLFPGFEDTGLTFSPDFASDENPE